MKMHIGNQVQMYLICNVEIIRRSNDRKSDYGIVLN